MKKQIHFMEDKYKEKKWRRGSNSKEGNEFQI